MSHAWIALPDPLSNTTFVAASGFGGAGTDDRDGLASIQPAAETATAAKSAVGVE